MTRRSQLPSPPALAKKLRSGDRAALSKAITLAESERRNHQSFTFKLLNLLGPFTGRSVRVGITGVPGVGKSTFIQALGLHLSQQGRRIGVLAVDPSSLITGGSILGDKTRMGELAVCPQAFIRPSPNSGRLGGVAAHTRETILLMEAAGYDTILVETVGTGQSESEIAALVDIVVLLLLPGAGDELQALKKGILELADVLVVHKAEGPNRKLAIRAVSDLRAALRINSRQNGSNKKILMTSALKNEGIEEFWAAIEEIEKKSKKTKAWSQKRKQQVLNWFHVLVEHQLFYLFASDSNVQKQLTLLEREVVRGRFTPEQAAQSVLKHFLRSGGKRSI